MGGAALAGLAVLAVAGWVGGRGLALVCASVRWGGQPGMPPRGAGVCVGGALTTSGAAACAVVHSALACLAG